MSTRPGGRDNRWWRLFEDAGTALVPDDRPDPWHAVALGPAALTSEQVAVLGGFADQPQVARLRDLRGTTRSARPEDQPPVAGLDELRHGTGNAPGDEPSVTP